MRTRRALVILAITALPLAPLPLVTAPALAQAAVPISDLLPGGGSGQQALDALGPAIAQAADLNEMSTGALTDILQDDDTAHLDSDGMLYYVEPSLEVPVGLAPRPAQGATAGSTSSAASEVIPALHSRDGSTHVIYLDFDGVTLAPTSAWATSNSIPAGTYTGFTLDNDPGTFNSAEVAFIEKVQKIVAEKYAPFDVDVTTVDPGADNYTRTDQADDHYGTHVVITNDTAPAQAICAAACAGIAYTGVFNRLDNAKWDPAWVFASNQFGPYKMTDSAQMTAHVAAHEAGHTFGLSHDGVTTTSGDNYYGGHGNWVPIMGITNQNAVAQFSKGEYPDANEHEDDLAIIGADGNSGAANSLLVGDDFPNDDPPYPLTVMDGYATSGIIGNAADDDTFRVQWPCTAPLTATATGIGAGQSLDLKVQVLDQTGSQVLAQDAPVTGQSGSGTGDIGFVPTGMDAEATLDEPQLGAEYRIRVDGTGNGTLANGYGDYGSIGQYHLEITGCPLPGAPGAPATASATPNPRTNTGTVSWTAPADEGITPVTGYTISGLPTGKVTLGNVHSYPATGLVPGTPYNLKIRAINASGAGLAASTTLRVSTWAPVTPPSATASASGTAAVLRWTAPANPGAATQSGWRIRGSGPGNAIDMQFATGIGVLTITGLQVGTHSFTVTGVYTADDLAGVTSSSPATVTILSKPSAPRIGLAATGTRGRPVTATARWSPPASTGGTAITSYRVFAYRLNSRGRVVQTLTKTLPGSARSVVWRLPAAKYKFRVVANNAVGASPFSAYSRIVTAR